MNDLKFREDQPIRESRSFRLDRQNGKLMGVCAGIGRYFGIDTTLVRVGFVLGTLLGFGSFILVYLGIALIAD
ncbi:PspC domain-containing protein [Qipengyuania gaetbuli]|uniref:PspC domain-containing protein n=1 Tax=Qipengyuania gaetbuli TaxID=266952 RepID=A0A844XWP1_9SPHN|nr:PspC domain-containing protein [Qipengyuania gaetbuli]MBY6014833.1 PspC domain-containing protein [Qipengyuania gaetbuli]MCA0910876.1 PspC domain-containing protein [Qipengyuania gaetbuli]MXO49996.1 PspC domain-containing protein [Qipengyuania gaetbuli]